MDTAQHVFYIIASVALGLFSLFLLFMFVMLLFVANRINRIARSFAAVSMEVRELIREAKSYSRYLGAKMGAGIIGKIIHFMRKRDHKDY